jgi:hypothetical protein
MDLAFNSANSYWDLLKHLSSDVKLELIARLSRSLQNDKSDSKSENVSASSFYGVWTDSDFPMDADSMVSEIKNSRSFKKKDIEALYD